MDMLQALATFTRVVETGSFSAVAREANSSNSAVSRQIAQLESHFRTRLFHRTTRHLSLTEDGGDLLTHARQIIGEAQALEDAFGRQRETPTGRVRVGMSAGAARLLTPGLVLLLDQYPGLSVEIIVREQFGEMIEDRLDLLIRAGQPADASLVTRSLGMMGRALVAAPAYLEKHGAPARPGDLGLHRCLVYEGGTHGAHWRFAGPGGPHDIAVTSPLSATSSDVVRHAALAGHGVALLPELQVLDDILASRLYRLLPDYPTEHIGVFLVYPSRRNLAPRTRVVIDHMIARFAAANARLTGERAGTEHDTFWLT